MPRCFPTLATVLLMLAAGEAAAAAASFPARAITIVCGFPPGNAADVQLRALAQAMARELRQPVVVENRPGAAGTLAAGLVAKSRPDGYTLVQVTNTVVRQPFIQPTGYDPIKDLRYVIGVTSFEFGLVVAADAPWRSFQEFTAYARQHPNKVSYGSIGAGSVPHQVMMRIGSELGISWTHVAYKGSTPAQSDLQGGHVHALSDTTGWTPLVEAGKLRLLAVYNEHRLARFPQVPTLKELGLDIADHAPWGLAAPAGTPPEHVRMLHDAARRALAAPEFLAALHALGNEVRYMSSHDYERYMAARVAIEREVVEAYGLGRRDAASTAR
ncbi:MAG TPA: tripartite tricarboxylate transporter substrate binding protein [Ramlibacter sp.]|jgi:tripartite-type tricarboxylate transporter receptor subunit TctC|nr:tripartite tricarboxylate transporter substrate binding protein [Ramlibacter sp.]